LEKFADTGCSLVSSVLLFACIFTLYLARISAVVAQNGHTFTH
jgi:hypothetical protein